MKNRSDLEMLFALSAGLTMQDYGEPRNSIPIKEKEERKEARLEQKRKRVLEEKGVNKYVYGDNVIYARNQKNADRKARNKGYID